MFQTNYIFKAQYLGRRLESIYTVAKRWQITNEEAAELMVTVEMQQSDNILNQKQHYKLFIEGSVHREKKNPTESNLLVEVPRIYREYDEDVFNKSRELNNTVFNYEIDDTNNTEILNNVNKMAKQYIIIHENVVGLNNANKLEKKDLRNENTDISNNVNTDILNNANTDILNNANKLEKKDLRNENVEGLNTSVTNQIRKTSIITKRKCTIMCSYV